MIYIGIDTGVNTGMAVWDNGEKAFISIETTMIHIAMARVSELAKESEVVVFVEDARLATFGRQNDGARAQGAGSVKRDAKIWQDFLKDKGIEFRMVRPSKSQKVSASAFTAITGLKLRLSQHARDAAMIVFKR